MNCFTCSNGNPVKFLDLGLQPPSDAFVRKEDMNKPERKYPLELFFCDTCGLVQLGHIVDPGELFTEYVYTTGMNNQLRANFKALVETLVRRFKVGSGDFAVDIGSNDGTLLKNYTQYGVRVLGIDPSSAAEIAEEQGIPTLRAFFNEATAQEVVQRYEHAKVITATNVFAHVPALDSFMRGITRLLAPRGVFVTESGYLLDMIETGGYDAVYHEHLRYYSLKPLTRLFGEFGMEVFDAERIESHSGSIRAYAARRGTYPVESSVARLIAGEEKAGLYRQETFLAFGKRAEKHRKEFCALLRKLKRTGTRIVGIGAPAKGNTLLNSCGVGTETIDALLEKSPLKIGLYAPGSHIPVKNEEILFSEQPEYALLLSWNLADELIPRIRSKGYKGKFIIPFPEIRVI
ncbi:MAG TPA: class I SAM-dependent methyltransferase [Candidatus Paceibacterota bacterium]